MASSSNNWREGEYADDGRVWSLPADESNGDEIVRALSSVGENEIEQKVITTSWTGEQIDQLCQARDEWRHVLCGSKALWYGLLLRDFNLHDTRGAMRNRTPGAARIISNAMSRFVTSAPGVDKVERARFLHQNLRALYETPGHKLPMAQRGTAGPFVDDATTLAIASRRFNGDEQKARRFVEAFLTEGMFDFVYDRGFVTILPCTVVAGGEALFFTDVISMIFDDQLLNVENIDQFVWPPLRPATDANRSASELVQYDTASSRHVPNAYVLLGDGGGNLLLWPPINDAHVRPQIFSRPPNAPRFVEKVPGNDDVYWYWSQTRPTIAMLWGLGVAVGVDNKIPLQHRDKRFRDARVHGLVNRKLLLSAESDELSTSAAYERHRDRRTTFEQLTDPEMSDPSLVSFAAAYEDEMLIAFLRVFHKRDINRPRHREFDLQFFAKPDGRWKPNTAPVIKFAANFVADSDTQITVLDDTVILAPRDGGDSDVIVLNFRVFKVNQELRDIEVDIVHDGNTAQDIYSIGDSVTARAVTENEVRTRLWHRANMRNMQRSVRCARRLPLPGVDDDGDDDGNAKRQRVRNQFA